MQQAAFGTVHASPWKAYTKQGVVPLFAADIDRLHFKRHPNQDKHTHNRTPSKSATNQTVMHPVNNVITSSMLPRTSASHQNRSNAAPTEQLIMMLLHAAKSASQRAANYALTVHAATTRLMLHEPAASASASQAAPNSRQARNDSYTYPGNLHPPQQQLQSVNDFRRSMQQFTAICGVPEPTAALYNVAPTCCMPKFIYKHPRHKQHTASRQEVAAKHTPAIRTRPDSCCTL
jgi:hypothetical protein